MRTGNRILYLLNTILGIFLLILACFTVFLTSKEETPPAPSTAPSLSDTEALISVYASIHGYSLSDYPDSRISLLKRNPEAKQFVLDYPMYNGSTPDYTLPDHFDKVPLFIQWDSRWGYRIYGNDVAGLTACGPVCLSMAACYVTGDNTYSPDYMMEFAEENGYCVDGDGTSWTLISEGGPMLGLDVTEIPLDDERILSNLEVGNPIICVVGPGDFTTSGHYIVMTAIENGKIQIHDPNSYENSEKLWNLSDISDQILNLWV